MTGRTDKQRLIRAFIISPAGTAVDKARSVGADLLRLSPAEMMKTPLSPTGEPPATHWLCKNYFSEDIVRRMKDHPTPLGTQVIDAREGTTAAILANRGLKRIVTPVPRA